MEVKKRETFIKSLNALSRDISNYEENANEKLKQSLSASNIKHFEITFEACRAYLQEILKVKYGKTLGSPRLIFKESFFERIVDEQTSLELMDLYAARNSSAHEYLEETPDEIYKRTKSYLRIFKKIEDLQLK